MRILILSIVVMFFTACQQGNSAKQQDAEKNSAVELNEEVLNIGKMHCQMCVASVEKGLKSVEGVEFVKVNLDDSTALVRFDASKANIDKFREAVKKRGYIVKDSGL